MLNRVPRARARMIVGVLAASFIFGSGAGGSFAAVLSASTPQPQSQPSVATFGVQPATASKPDPTRSYFSFGATDGAALSDHIAVVNYTFRSLTLTLHPTDAINTPQGDLALIPPDQRSTQVGLWIKIAKGRSTITIKPRGTVIVPFHLAIPKNAQPGDHAGGIIATLESFARSASGQRYRLLQSVGTRVFIRLSGVLRPDLAVVNVSPHYHDSLDPFGGGRVVVTYVVKNVGNVALGGNQTVRISGLFGLSATAKDVRQLKVLLPGFSAAESVEIRGVFPQFLMTVHVSIKPLILPGTVQTLPDSYTGSAHFWAIPWILIAIILLLLLGEWWLRRRRRRKPSPAITVGTSLSPTDTKGSGAESNGRAPEPDPAGEVIT